MQNARPIAVIADRSIELARFAIVSTCALALILAGQALPF